jgi:hypothetical protein
MFMEINMTPYYEIKDAGGNWIAGTPTVNGQHYRYFDMWGGVTESYWYIEPEELP